MLDNIPDPREVIIRNIYIDLLGREPDETGLKYYLEETNDPLEFIYIQIYSSKEAEDYRKKWEERNRNLPITLAMMVKNCEDSVHIPINSVKSIVREIVVLDTGSTDNTPKVCEELGARVYKCNFLDFGHCKTIAAHLAREPFILMLDNDEEILPEDLSKFEELIENEDIDIWCFPRRRWKDLERTEEVHPEVYPDWQMRFWRNIPDIRYERRIHEHLVGSEKALECPDHPVIQHYQDVFKKGDALKARNEMYKELQDLDIAEGIEHREKAFEDVDDV